MSKLPEIPSEYIEPYLVKFMSYLIESIAMGFKTPQQAKDEFKGIEHFVSQFCGIHARLACGNEYYSFIGFKDEDLQALCDKVYATTKADSLD
jgi:hypothetical protein